MPRLLILALILKISFIALAFSLGNTEGSLAFIFVLHGFVLEMATGKHLAELKCNQERLISMVFNQSLRTTVELNSLRESLNKED